MILNKLDHDYPYTTMDKRIHSLIKGSERDLLVEKKATNNGLGYGRYMAWWREWGS